MFSVTVDLERGSFETAMYGFWTLDTLADFGGTLEQAIRRIRATGRDPVSLCDYSAATVQSQAVIAGFIRMMRDPAVRARRVAVYIGGALARRQAMRANRDHAEFRFFTDEAEARAWLFAPEDAAA